MGERLKEHGVPDSPQHMVLTLPFKVSSLLNITLTESAPFP